LKIYTVKKRNIDIIRSLKDRSQRKKQFISSGGVFDKHWRTVNLWVDKVGINNVDLVIEKNNQVTIHLPEVMNFSTHYDTTVLVFTAIRNLVNVVFKPKKAYRLSSVNFEGLKTISTSAALVLTAELSKWEDSIRKRLIPKTDTWDEDIRTQLYALGFFDIFKYKCDDENLNVNKTNLEFVRYIKGKCTEKSKTAELKSSIQNVVGNSINKWTFLDSGLSEAITNVSHHAYPKSMKVYRRDRNWYLTGSFNNKTNVLKIAFYDQGIGIPKSLPASDVWEKVKKAISIVAKEDRFLHKTLLKAAVRKDRTRTYEPGRGQGLYDMLTFIKQRKEGHLSIISLKGLYKYTMLDGVESEKSVSFRNELKGTLIIWSVTL
jgi:hypothetical protein